MEKIVLAYSGGLDTSVSIRWLQETYGYEVVAVTADVGEADRDLPAIQARARTIGAAQSLVADLRQEFARDYVLPTLRAGALYQGRYPLSAALSRPLIAKLLVQVARQVGATAVAHGCTGKGNDQVRFDVSVAALAPDLKVVAPVREWHWSRDQEISWALAHDVPIPVAAASPYSFDTNLWGRSIECGVLEDPAVEPPEEVFDLTVSPALCPDQPAYVTVDFEAGVPVGIDGVAHDPVTLIEELNATAGQNGVGRLDMVEDRLVGIKSREVYEAPAAVALHAAYQELLAFTQPRETLQILPPLSQRYAELVYNGLWFAPVRDALDALFGKVAEKATGSIRLRFWKGTCVAVGRRAAAAMYNQELATYSDADGFDHAAAAGFIALWGLPTRVWARTQDRAKAGVAGQ